MINIKLSAHLMVCLAIMIFVTACTVVDSGKKTPQNGVEQATTPQSMSQKPDTAISTIEPTTSAECLSGDWFELYYENLAENPATDFNIDMYFSQGLGTGVGLWPPLNNSTVQWLKNDQHGLMLNYIASTDILELKQVESQRFAPSMDNINVEKMKMIDLTKALGNKVWWDIMPEWDSTDYAIGRMEFPFCWKNQNKPVRTRQESFIAFKDYYLNMKPLGDYLRQTRDQRGFNICSTSGNTWTPNYAYEFGADLAMLERDLDTIGDIQTGIAFTRGAGSQHNKPWGIDISEWRSAGNSATSYDSNNQRTGGWSESYHKRHLYISYMSGANIIRLEPVYLLSGAQLNPFGKVVKDFADFALKKHKDRGTPVVPTALLLDHDSGWNPRYWTNQRSGGQGDMVWFGTIPYSDGDWMLDNLFEMIYPGYWLHGTTPNAPWKSPEEYNQMVKDGLDTRPYEPMGSSRWGDSFDVLYNNATLEALQNYKMVMLAGGVAVDSKLKADLKKYVENGGVVVINTRQADISSDEAFFGVKPAGGKRTASDSKWMKEEETIREPEYEYSPITLTTAVPLASNGKGDILISQNTVGKGQVILTTLDYLQDKLHNQILNIGKRLMDEIQDKYSLVSIDGEDLLYLVNQDENRIIVTLVNNSGKTWDGNIVMNKPQGTYTAMEWLEEKELGYTEEAGKIKIKAEVPAYDLRIYSLDCKKENQK